MMLFRVILALTVTVGAPVAVWLWLWLAEHLEAALPQPLRSRGRAVLWLLPATAFVGTFLVWPLLNTIWLSLHGPDGQSGASLDNLRWLSASSTVRAALVHNLLWVVLLVTGCIALGLVVAVLANSVRYEAVAKGVIVAPTAISFVCGAVIWRFMYDYQAPGLPQIGTFNAVWTDVLDHDPVAWLVDRHTNNYALILIGLWSTLGLATIIISAALKGIPDELLEAAKLDGANAGQAFRHIVLPLLRPTLVVVATLVGITALKAFDIVYVLTNGNYGTNVIANVLYSELFVAQRPGRASAVALLLTVVALPLFAINALVARSRRRA